MNNSNFVTYLVIFAFALGSDLSAGYITPSTIDPAISGKDTPVTFDAIPDNGTADATVVSFTGGSGTKSGNTVTFYEAGKTYNVTVEVSHTGSDDEACAGGTFDFVFYTPKVKNITVDSSDTKSEYLGALGATSIIGTLKGSDDVSLRAEVEPDVQIVKDALTWVGATADSDNSMATLPRGTEGKFTVTGSFAVTSEGHTADVYSLKTEVTELGFSGDHKLTAFSSDEAIDESDSTPVWAKSSSPDLPVAYTKGAEPTAFGKLSVTPALPDGFTLQVTLQAKRDSSIVATKDSVELVASESTFSGAEFSTSIETSVKKLAVSLSWEASIDGTDYNPMNSTGPITFYSTNGTPTVDPIYDVALNTATLAINGDADMAGKLNARVAALPYNPAAGVATSTLDDSGGVLDALYEISGNQCVTNSYLLRYLLKSIGTDGGSVLTYYFGAHIGQVMVFQYRASPVGYASFQCNRPAKGPMPSNPFFIYHAMTTIGTTIYDPSYGMTGVPSFLTYDPLASLQIANYSLFTMTEWVSVSYP